MRTPKTGKTRAAAAWLVLALAVSSAAAQPELVVLDTDSAVFNDDGAALVMLLRQPEKVRLLGITVVSGNHRAAQGAEHLLHVLELLEVRDVPLFVGAHAPLVNSPERARIYQQQWGRIRFLGGFAETGEVQPPHGGRFAELRPQEEDAVSFLVRTIEQNPDRVTVLAIGPLTNLAILLQLRPDLAPRIKRLVFMGGNARVGGNVTPYAEFNFFYDPEAARRVLHSEIPEKWMFGLDVTNQAVLRREHFDRIASAETPITELFAHDMGHGWPGFYQNPDATGYVWDCLAAAWLLDPSLFPDHERLPIDVNIEFGPAYGGAFVAGHGSGVGVEVVTGVEFGRFFELYRELLTR